MKKGEYKKYEHFATVENIDAAIKNRDSEAFKSLRLYYRKNFKDGHSDKAFLSWCADMMKACAMESVSTDKDKKMKMFWDS